MNSEMARPSQAAASSNLDSESFGGGAGNLTQRVSQKSMSFQKMMASNQANAKQNLNSTERLLNESEKQGGTGPLDKDRKFR